MVSLKDVFHNKRRLPRVDLFKVTLILSALIGAFSVFYYLVVFIPGKERVRIELEREQDVAESSRLAAEETDREFNRNMLDACLADAEINYSDYWDKECKSQGLGKDCSLPQYNADRANDFRSELKNDCFKLYPASSR